MPDITLHRSTRDAEHWLAMADGSLVAEGAYADVKQAAKLAAAPRGKVTIGTPVTPKGSSSMSVSLQQPKAVDTGHGISGKGIGKKKKRKPAKTKPPAADSDEG